MYVCVWDHEDNTTAHLSMHSGIEWIEVQKTFRRPSERQPHKHKR
jgi:hypothetical protein